MDIPAVTLNAQCGSSHQVVNLAASAIAAGDADVVVASGVESMTRVPLGSDRTSSDSGSPFTAWGECRSSRCSGCQANVARVSAESARKPTSTAPAGPILAESPPRRSPGIAPHRAPQKPAVVEVEIGDPAEHAGEVRQQHAQPDDEERGALHVQRTETLEPGERQADAQQRDAERARAKPAPERRARGSARSVR